MRLVLVLLVLVMVGCASNKSRTSTTNELMARKYSNNDCGQIDQHIKFLESQLQARGLTNAVPEQLNEDDRVYNATVRIMVWNLRIGCNDLNRYSKK